MVAMIVFIAPYEKLKDEADELIPYYDVPIKTVVGDLDKGLLQAWDAINDESILVSRGGTAKLIRENFKVDVIEVGLSQMDLLRIFKPYIARPGRGQGRIAVVGFHSLTDPAEQLCHVLDIPAIFLPVNDEREVGSRIEILANTEFDCLVGDMVSIRYAAKLNVKLHLIESGRDAIRDALDKAVVAAHNIHFRKERDIRLRAVLNAVQEGVLSINKNGMVEHLNQTASELVGPLTAAGLPSDEILPLMDIRETIEHQKPVLGKLLKIKKRDVALNLTPIVVGGTVEGAVAVLQDVSKIQAIEKKVRRQLYAKGLFAKHHFSDILAQAENMRSCIAIARKYAKTSGNIHIYGETGTGKELLAQSIHNTSPMNDGPFVAINCGALPPTLLESELFGYVEGAFTGAAKAGKAGFFELAHGGTIFLDEINELDINLQGKLLRVLQEREVIRIGDTKVIPVSVRVISASNLSLTEEINSGRFRMDLFYRLSVLDIRIPPLRERKEDILPLFNYFLGRNTAGGPAKSAPLMPPMGLLEKFTAYSWPGNVRELENIVEKWVTLRELFDEEKAVKIILEALPDQNIDREDPALENMLQGNWAAIERNILQFILSREGGNISRTARRLHMDRQTLRHKIM
jgi:transcriptional regulator with PAS, ATPase and Fis domain